MTSSSPQMPDREERLDEAAAAYLEAIESGQRPNRSEWLARYPDLAAELGEFIDDQARMHRWTGPIGGSSGTAPDDAIGNDPLATLHVPGGSVGEGPRRFPNYQLLGEIARGGMGIVYRARQLNPNRIVALKMILAGPHASSSELYRFRMETDAAATLDHPHIMPIYEVGDQDGRPFFSMKLMEGGTLAEHLPRFAGDGRAVAGLLIKVARAVHHAHQRGILHRDLKPANILLDAQGEPFVTDFGLCRRVEVDSGMTQSGVIVGTPSYMSPEQAAGRKGLTTATDVYSLGAILYTLLTDRPPFRGDTPLETVRGVLEDEPSRPRLLRPQVDRDLETICLKCLDKQPQRRYGSAEALADDVQRWLAGEPIIARRSSIWERTWKRTRRNPAAAALVAVSSLALIFLIAAGLIYQNQRIDVAERALARANHISQLRGEASVHIRNADSNLRSGDAQSAKAQANLALAISNDEPELLDLVKQAQQLLKKAGKQIKLELDRTEATESFRRILAQRDDVLFYGSQFASEVPANLQAAQAAGNTALKEIGLTPEGKGSLQLSASLSDDQRRAMSAASYELLLVLADVATRQNPPQATRAARLKQRADELRTSLPGATALDEFQLGYEARQRGDLTGAINAFRRTIHIQPNHIWARYFLAACCLPARPDVAEAHLTTLLDERPELYSAWLLRAIAHANLGETAAAEDDFAAALERAPRGEQSAAFRYATLVIRGDFRTRRGDFAAAEQDLLEAARLKPDAHLAWLYLAQTYERTPGRVPEAAQQLEQALAAQDLTPPVESGILLYRARRFAPDADAAQADIDRSIRLFPYAEAHVYLAENLAEKKHRGSQLTKEDFQAVVNSCDAALTSPAYSPAYQVGRTHYLRASALVGLGRHDDAAKALDRYLAGGGKPTAEIHRLRGLIRAEHKDYPAAIRLFEDSLALDRENRSTSATLAERGNIYLARSAYGLALADFEAALARDKDNANALAGRGLVRAMQKDFDGAEDDAERAWVIDRQTPRIAWMAARTLALVHARLRSQGTFVSVQESKDMVRYRKRAVELLEQALALTPPDEQGSFWRDVVQHDVWLSQLSDQPKYRELAQKYSPAAAVPTTEL